jgi:hypothetical protein
MSAYGLRAMRVTIKHHRFELAIAALVLFGMALWAISIEARLAALGIPQACIQDTLEPGPPTGAGCGISFTQWTGLVIDEATPLVGWMLWVPLVIGLLVSVPIVARELETRTAQTAWSLYGSRRRWLVAQLLPIAAVFGLGLVVLSLAASVLEQHRVDWGFLGWLDMGMHGLPAIARGAAAFGVGTLTGAVIGRSLPAIAAGLAILLLVGGAVGWLGNQWLAAQPQTLIDNEGSAVLTGWRWSTPDHQLETDAEARAHVPEDVAALDDGSPQPVNSMEWLEQHGYQLVAIGVSDETALGWAPYYSGLFAAVAVVALIGAVVVVDRRRPT